MIEYLYHAKHLYSSINFACQHRLFVKADCIHNQHKTCYFKYTTYHLTYKVGCHFYLFDDEPNARATIKQHWRWHHSTVRYPMQLYIPHLVVYSTPIKTKKALIQQLFIRNKAQLL